MTEAINKVGGKISNPNLPARRPTNEGNPDCPNTAAEICNPMTLATNRCEIRSGVVAINVGKMGAQAKPTSAMPVKLSREERLIHSRIAPAAMPAIHNRINRRVAMLLTAKPEAIRPSVKQPQ